MTSISRRTFIKGAGAATGAAVVGGGSMALDNGPVQESEAILPAALAVGAAVAAGWALREYEVIGADDHPEGLTQDALEQETYESFRKRESSDKSTFVDNQNIIDSIDHTAYSDAKLAAIKAINNSATESEVLDAANNTIDQYHTTVKKNALKSWNEGANEFKNAFDALEAHPDASTTHIRHTGSGEDRGVSKASPTYDTVTLPDGTSFDVMTFQDIDASNMYIDPIDQYGDGNGNDYTARLQVTYDGSTATILDHTTWENILEKIDTTFDDVRNGISTWVSNVYGSVQSGEVEVTDLLSPREQAEMMTDDGGYPQAVADLIALNIPMDLERKAKITYTPRDEQVTLVGKLGLTDTATIEVGNTYDPANLTGDVYFTYDVGTGTGTWSRVETAIDGGVLTFTAEPYENVVYNVTTTAGETVQVEPADFTDNGDGTYSVDLTDKLETAITEVDTIEFESPTNETQYETVQIKSSFTVKSITNEETGESEDSLSFTNSEPQDDTNYITQQEWDDLNEQNQELIEKYEEETSGGGGALLEGFSMFGLPGEAVALIGAGGAALLFANN
ncbi:twin-arginine translocation signal domain-containing protein [Halobellus ordinarius]|uniref:twin-arginine translocation signal domain-containing protein n=1 Tax=Halobellus ordinarius TaxID=3075120 RepID=UPI0028805C64|nr:twin-arginine translocation signal domain-containing protein [Halobellus sp. ZY16]